MIRALIRFIFRNKGCSISWCSRPEVGDVVVTARRGGELRIPFCEKHKLIGMKATHDDLLTRGAIMPPRIDMFEVRRKKPGRAPIKRRR